MRSENRDPWQHETVEKLANHYKWATESLDEARATLEARDAELDKLRRASAAARGLLEEVEDRLSRFSKVVNEAVQYHSVDGRIDAALMTELRDEVEDIFRDAVKSALELLTVPSGPAPPAVSKRHWRSRRGRKWRAWLDARFGGPRDGEER